MFPWRRHVVSRENAMTEVSFNGSFRPCEPITDGKGINRDDCFTESRLITTRSFVVYIALATLMAPRLISTGSPVDDDNNNYKFRNAKRRNEIREKIDRKMGVSRIFHSPPVNIYLEDAKRYTKRFTRVCQESRRYVRVANGCY